MLVVFFGEEMRSTARTLTGEVKQAVAQGDYPAEISASGLRCPLGTNWREPENLHQLQSTRHLTVPGSPASAGDWDSYIFFHWLILLSGGLAVSFFFFWLVLFF